MTPLLIQVAVSGEEEGQRIGGLLVEERLAVCVHLLPPIHSTYRWQGQIESAIERLLIIKSSQELWECLVARIRALHSYECPEIIALPVQTVEKNYLNWWTEGLLDRAL